MASLGTQSRPFSFPPSLTCLNFNHHDFVCTLKTNVLAELSSSAALFQLSPDGAETFPRLKERGKAVSEELDKKDSHKNLN